MPKVVSLLLKVRSPGAVTVAAAPPVSILPPFSTFTTKGPAKVVLSVPAVAWLSKLQVTLGPGSPAQAASALCGLPAITAMKAPVNAVLASSKRRGCEGTRAEDCTGSRVPADSFRFDMPRPLFYHLPPRIRDCGRCLSAARRSCGHPQELPPMCFRKHKRSGKLKRVRVEAASAHERPRDRVEPRAQLRHRAVDEGAQLGRRMRAARIEQVHGNLRRARATRTAARRVPRSSASTA